MAIETTLGKPNLPAPDLTEAADSNGYASGVFIPRPGSAAERLADSIGAFKDDPMLDAMMENIRRRRREIDADDNIV